jgi:hypothetical protein
MTSPDKNKMYSISDNKISSTQLVNISTRNHESIIINNPGGVINELSKIQDDAHPILFQVRNNPSFIDFKNAIKDLELCWTRNGDSNLTMGKIKYEEFLNEIQFNKTDKYIFDINTEYNEKVKRITDFIPCPDLYFLNKDCPNVSIYSGCKHTGSKIHSHHEAVNYLILGKKIWIIFPNNDDNKKICSDEFIKNSSSINWLFLNANQLKRKIDGLNIFIQYAGDIVFIPKRFYHGAINLENSHGFVYSSTIL